MHFKKNVSVARTNEQCAWPQMQMQRSKADSEKKYKARWGGSLKTWCSLPKDKDKNGNYVRVTYSKYFLHILKTNFSTGENFHLHLSISETHPNLSSYILVVSSYIPNLERLWQWDRMTTAVIFSWKGTGFPGWPESVWIPHQLSSYKTYLCFNELTINYYKIKYGSRVSHIFSKHNCLFSRIPLLNQY